MAMMSIRLFRSPSRSGQSVVRPLNPNRDLAAVSRLLELVFRQTVGRNKRGALVPAYPARWLPFSDPPVPGFVYEHDNRIVGNVSILESRDKGHYLVANVAVHPDYRRRGFALALMKKVIAYTQARRGKTITLQVEKENESAKNLYANLAFRPLGITQAWQTSYHALRQIRVPFSAKGEHFHKPDRFDGFELRPLRRTDAGQALMIDQSTFPSDLLWSDGFRKNVYNTHPFMTAINMMNGIQDEIWVAAAPDQSLIGLGSINSIAARPHLLKLRVPAEHREAVMRPLLAKLIRRLKTLNRRPILIDFLEEETDLEALLVEAGFRHKRTLTTMRYNHPSH